MKGFAENPEDGSVKVVCVCEEEGINELINSIKGNTFLYFLQNKCSLCVKKVIHIRKLFM
ncbi:MAG: acylphosphatase [Methanophagales archaeon]|nr:acylphosphatase [Methanophagales archaeon]